MHLQLHQALDVQGSFLYRAEVEALILLASGFHKSKSLIPLYTLLNVRYGSYEEEINVVFSGGHRMSIHVLKLRARSIDFE